MRWDFDRARDIHWVVLLLHPVWVSVLDCCKSMRFLDRLSTMSCVELGFCAEMRSWDSSSWTSNDILLADVALGRN